MATEHPARLGSALKFRVLKPTALFLRQQNYQLTAIEALYPELNHITENRNYLYYLAHWDLALNLADNANRFGFCQQIGFTRLNELHILSYLQRPHHDGDPALLSRLFYQWARDQLNHAREYFVHAVPIRYNLLAIDLILARSFEERITLLEQMASLIEDVTKYGESMVAYQQFISNIYQALKNNPRLPHSDFSSVVAIPLLGQSAHELADIRLSADERAQAFACRSRLFVGSLPHGDGRLDYCNVMWRTGLLTCLIEAESIADNSTLQMGCVGPLDPPFMAEAQKRPWRCFKALIPDELPPNLDVVTLWHMNDLTDTQCLEKAIAKLKPGGLLIAAGSRSGCRPDEVRTAFESATQSTCYLIDRESFTDLLVVYVIKGQYMLQSLRVLVVIPPYSIWTFGGFEWQLFKSRRYLKQRDIHTDISLACRLDAKHYDAIYVLGCAHEDYKVRYLQAFKRPKLYMPVPLLFETEHTIGQRLTEHLKECRKQEPASDLSHFLQQWDFNSWRQRIANEKALSSPDHEVLQRIAQACDYFIPQSTLELRHMFPDKQPFEIPHQLILNGCEHDRFEYATPELFLETYHPPDHFILCVGRIDPNKNQLLLCQALRSTDLPLVLIGAIDDPDYFEMCLEVSNGRILHLQDISIEMLASALKAAKLFVLPSCSEVFPLATVEAAWAGCPIVMTRCSGQAELFGDSVIYIDPFDITEMRHAILDVYHANNTIACMKAKNNVRQQVPTWQQMGEQIADVLLRCSNGEF